MSAAPSAQRSLQTGPGRAGSTATRLLRRPEAGAAVGAVVVFLIFAGTAGGFVGAQATASWLSVAAELGIVAVPIGLLMIAGEFDLFIGSVLATSSMIVAVSTTTFGLPVLVGAALALAFGVGVGLLNGLLVTRTGLPSFILTLVTLFALAGGSLGVARLLTGTTSLSMPTEGFAHTLFAGQLGGFPISIVWWLLLAAGGWWVLHRSRFGNWITAVGGDAQTARQSGVPVRSVLMRLYAFSGFGAALVGVIQAVEFGNADVTRGQSFVFESIVAAVVGGTLLSGGYGSVIGIVLGTATYAIVSTGVYYTGWDTDLVQLFVGVLLLLAVIGNTLVRRLALTRP